MMIIVTIVLLLKNLLRAENFAARSAEANLASKKDIDDLIKKDRF